MLPLGNWISLTADLVLKSSTITISLAALSILYTRSFTSVYCASGAVVCTLIAKVLKRVIKQSRPKTKHRALNVSIAKKYVISKVVSEEKQYGMPSSHSAAITFFSSFISGLIYESNLASPIKILSTIIVNIIAFTVGWSRIFMGHHTWAQVLAGVALGSSFGLTWFSWKDVIKGLIS
ncbi:hypothetical protein HDU97_009783 [Phlyctochytrium planicorne]|nr:hypothetical protein HDU97_009783 [Phlyctochytrium planicorne]